MRKIYNSPSFCVVILLAVLIPSAFLYLPKMIKTKNITSDEDWEVTGSGTVTVTSVTELKAQVKNVNGIARSEADVLRYNSNWNYIDKSVTDALGWAIWSPISPGTYYLEVYYAGEFWGSYEVTVKSGESKSMVLGRYMPWCYSTNFPSEVYVGDNIEVKVTVKTLTAWNPNVRVRFIIDRDKTTPYDFDQTSLEQSIPAGSTKDFTFTYKTSAVGTHYITYFVETYLPGPKKWVLTDKWWWGLSVAVIPRPPTVGTFAVTVVRGQEVTVDITITNPNPIPIRVTDFTVIDYGGLKGTITPINLPIDISANSAVTIRVKIAVASDCPTGTYTIRFKVTGTP